MRDPQVFLNMLRAMPFLLISAIGMTFVIVSGGIDLSVGGVVALTTVASAALLRGNGMDPWVVMGLMLIMGMAFGATMGNLHHLPQGPAVHRHAGRSVGGAGPVLLHQRQRDPDPQPAVRGPRGNEAADPGAG